MAGLLTTSSTLMCPHGGTITATTTNAKTRAAGDFVLRASDTFIIAGCPVNVAGAPHPCITVRWVQPALKVKVLGDFVLTEESVGLCVAADQAVQGTVMVQTTQPKVAGQ